MQPSIENNFLLNIPKEKKSKPHIVLPLLLVIIIAGYVIVYQISKTNDKIPTEVLSDKSDQLSNQELFAIAELLNKSSSSSPPPKPAELKKVAEYLNKQSEKQKPLTNEELQKIAETLNK